MDPGGTVCGLVLAAGASRRAGPTNKLLAEVEGEPMVRRVAGIALAGGLAPVVVVTPRPPGAIGGALAGLPVLVAENGDAAKGLSASLRCGLAVVPPEASGVAVLLGDMPWVSPATVRALAVALRSSAGRSPCVPVYRGRRGNPLTWPARFFAEMRALEGDRGARSLLAAHADEVLEVPVDDGGILRDVDTPADLASLRHPPVPSAGPTSKP